MVSLLLLLFMGLVADPGQCPSLNALCSPSQPSGIVKTTYRDYANSAVRFSMAPGLALNARAATAVS